MHAGQEPDPATGAVVVPIHPASTFAQDGVGVPRAGFEYARSGNPTRMALETSLAALEGGRVGLAFSSGLAAEDALLRAVCRPGDHALIPIDAYGGTYRLFHRVYAEWGLRYTPVDLSDLDAVRTALRHAGEAGELGARSGARPAGGAGAGGAGGGGRRAGGTRLVWCETPTNPLLSIADLAALAELAHAAGALLVVDNTFASPYLQRPLALGADAVVHSTTKYLGGHSDVVGGAVVVDDPELAERVRFTQNAAGAVPGPFDAWLVLRGIKTLPVRMDRHCANAARVAELLLGHPGVAEVRYPGLPTHPGHLVAARQMSGFGGMVSFSARGGEAAAEEICRRTRLFTLAESLGGVESLIEHPGRMTHASAAGSPLAVPGDLVRLSVGIESVDDLLADLRQALDAAAALTD
ncbi:aminotransferase class I/II-fold pyridoxal phosphate-dependent enzyme [Frankia sp. CNm7]|uniref:Aminotransferase class I/II-fold pyridoxal phosphate-dependent enzyme n=1 Tax=Frankia nepalensis TaxID=1836974 RepID=A0A937RN40_9ACTN|nr:aminotransferase class I/II-fold pyridoxal phosphate-dependent enzyme [Frankia nepalensis]MBL7497730.1 aminotransferase class I/II-fold pyridoxal phosphate-dependent enzyme [Frankia nepalensis]MBL7509741.1 aminotransferase class I/II-fold pyridoxal phosphate-dependent enzyme [Frankia nepalensis]MBL7516911.1 aminotransferase class I/II-fold pyridoxal phosphate-dependent enzyme [Frankia nepalensis]MBL7629468.1 aminotransferase class I/II-fold pyridoxal phosphate-dependent enzyme [Frankia nepal